MDCFTSQLQDEQRELAKTIRVSGSILLSTVSNFLDFFKMEAGKALDIVRTEVDIQVLVCPRCSANLQCISVRGIWVMMGRSGGWGVLLRKFDALPVASSCRSWCQMSTASLTP
jgi:hypothetical protein